MNGREQADREFEDFVRCEWPRLVRLARVLGADNAAAEDLVQIALTKTYARWSSVRDNRASYVRRVLVTSNADRFRGRQRHDNQVGYTADRQNGDAAGSAPDHSAAYGERQEQLAALRALPPRMRAVIVLRYYEDWSDEQIADALGCTRGTVRSTAGRALLKLRSAISVQAACSSSSRPGGI